MRTVLASIILFFSMALAAAACPNWQFTGATFNYSSQQLQTPQQFSAAAVGGYDLSTCQTPGAFTRGFAGAAPNYTFNLSGDGAILPRARGDQSMRQHHAGPCGQWLLAV